MSIITALGDQNHDLGAFFGELADAEVAGFTRHLELTSIANRVTKKAEIG